MSHSSIILLAIFASIIGAVPFGLVNLSVVDVSYRSGKSAAMHVAHGATWVEVLFGFTSVMAGSLIGQYTRNNQLVQFLVLFLPAFVGLVFILKKSTSEIKKTEKYSGFFKGVLFNLISVQVLIYWLFAMTYINTRWNLEFDALSITLFILGIWLGKMLVLWVYALYGRRLFTRFGFLSRNINRVIGISLILSVILQFFKGPYSPPLSLGRLLL